MSIAQCYMYIHCKVACHCDKISYDCAFEKFATGDEIVCTELERLHGFVIRACVG